MITKIANALLYTQKALLGVVTPQLRAVTVDIAPEDKVFYISFFYDGEVTDAILKDWESAIREAGAGFGPEYFTDRKIERLDFPKKIPAKGRYAYLRKEKTFIT